MGARAARGVSYPGTPFVDLDLARTLERLVADELRRFVTTALELDSECGAETLDVAGGVAVFVAHDSPLNQAVGLGMAGPVTDDDVHRVCRFFEERGEPAVLALCPLAHPTLAESLAHEGWAADCFENVLLRALDDDPPSTPPLPGITIVEAESEEERDLWGLVAATGFSAPLDPSATQIQLCGLVSRRPRARLMLALVDGRPAGTGELFIADGVGWLSADATLPQFRGRGIQSALQAHRLTIARSEGCRLAVSEAAPGSTSQRNMQRHGFEVGYTRVTFVTRAAE